MAEARWGVRKIWKERSGWPRWASSGSAEEVVLTPRGQAVASVILLHGLGAFPRLIYGRCRPHPRVAPGEIVEVIRAAQVGAPPDPLTVAGEAASRAGLGDADRDRSS